MHCITRAGRLGRTSRAKSASHSLDDLDVLLQGSGIVVPIPGDAIVALDWWCQGPEGHSGMREFFDVLARQCDAQAFGDEGHQARFQLGVLQDPRREAGLLAGSVEPVAKTRMCLLGHAYKKQSFQLTNLALAL